MIDGWPRALTFAGVLGAGLAAGSFFAFSAFVMKALARLGPEKGITAMQSINITVINPLFMAVFLGTGGVCLVLAATSVLRWSRPGSGLLLTGSLLYLLGTILVTMRCNVPRNDLLAAVDPASAEGTRVWADYVKDWTLWNHVRTAAALAAAAAFTLAMHVMEA
jgi:uncharacterized membrane protein